MDGATWVNWAELAVLDLSATPEHFAGRLSWSSKPRSSVPTRQMVPTEWPVGVSEAVGPPLAAWSPDVERLDWETADLTIRYESLSIGTVLGGPDSHWPHVFAVMRALAGRFGDERPSRGRIRLTGRATVQSRLAAFSRVDRPGVVWKPVGDDAPELESLLVY